MHRRTPLLATVAAVLALLAAAALPLTTRAQVFNQPPSVSISHPGNGTVVQGEVNVTGNATDTDGEVERVEVRIDDGRWRNATGTSPWNLTWDTQLWASGEHNVTARAWDGSEYSDNETVNVTVDQAPSVTVESPLNGTTVAGDVEVNGTASDPENALETVRLRVDQGPWRNVTGTQDWSYTWNTTNVTDGNHSVTVEADDGNTADNETVTVTVENEPNQPPTVAVEEPAEGATVDGEVEVAGTANDPDGSVEEVRVRIDDGVWRKANGTSSWSLTWDTTEWQEGDHEVVARADDGNATATANLTVTVDNGEGAQEARPPTVEITSPAHGARVSGAVQIQGEASDPDGEVERVEVRVDEDPWRTAEGTTTWNFTWDADQVSPGSHEVKARALSAERSSPVHNITLHVTEDEPPAITIRRPENGTTVEGEIEVAGEVTGDTGPVDGVEVRVGNGSWQTAEGVADWTFPLDATALDAGPQRIEARAVTAVGPQPSAWVEVTVEGDELEPSAANRTSDEDQAPTLTLEEPADGATAGGELTVAGTVQDPDDDQVEVQVLVDGEARTSFQVATGERFRETVAADGLEPGEHTVTVLATDDDQGSDEQTARVTVEDDAMVNVPGPALALALLGVAAAARYRRT